MFCEASKRILFIWKIKTSLFLSFYDKPSSTLIATMDVDMLSQELFNYL